MIIHWKALNAASFMLIGFSLSPPEGNIWLLFIVHNLSRITIIYLNALSINVFLYIKIP